MNINLISDWDYELNGDVDPKTLPDHSNKKAYWKCPKGHPAYYMSVAKRTRGDGCPVCSNHKIIKGINDFASCNPELMNEWFWAANEKEGIDPTSYSSGSGVNAWWKCKKCGNTWKASIVNRAKKNSGCPYCSNYKVKKGFNDLQTINPKVAEEWDYEKNGNLTPDTVVAYYSKKVWWKCKKCGHSWEASPNARSKSGCPLCSKRIIVKGYNDFETEYPELAAEWDFTKNENIFPFQFASGSEKRVWWKCEKGHSWKAAINSRVSGRGCPICSNKKVLLGFNDLFTTNPELKQEWDYEKNSSIDPTSIVAGSNKKAYWICKECGFSWKAIIASRASGNGCPECGKKKNQANRLKTMALKNPLFEQFPELQKEWDYNKNSNLDLTQLPASSNRLAWWVCEKGHSYRTRIVLRTMKKVGCPYCHGQKVLTGVNDLQTLNPKLAEEWDYEKNKPLTPSDVLSHSSKTVWWKCPICGNAWRAKINNRANGRGCPACNPYGTSFIEQALFYYIKKAFPDAENRVLFDGIELDIYIPSKNTAIEYDGAYYHSSENAASRESRKDLFCKGKGIVLIRLREKPLEPTENAINVSCENSTWTSLTETCNTILSMLNPKERIDVSIKRDYSEIVQSKRELIKDNSFVKQYPALLEEWDYEKNAPLLPDYFSRGSNVKVWWVCKEGHSWQAAIANRCNGSGCPVCFREKRAQGLHRKKQS